jgi:nucleoside-diphosphate-sugar epimerase
MRVLITGGAGYVGYSLVRQLLTTTGPLDSIAIYDN